MSFNLHSFLISLRLTVLIAIFLIFNGIVCLSGVSSCSIILLAVVLFSHLNLQKIHNVLFGFIIPCSEIDNSIIYPAEVFHLKFLIFPMLCDVHLYRLQLLELDFVYDEVIDPMVFRGIVLYPAQLWTNVFLWWKDQVCPQSLLL